MEHISHLQGHEASKKLINNILKPIEYENNYKQ